MKYYENENYVGMDAHLCNVTITNKVSNNGS